MKKLIKGPQEEPLGPRQGLNQGKASRQGLKAAQGKLLKGAIQGKLFKEDTQGSYSRQLLREAIQGSYSREATQGSYSREAIQGSYSGKLFKEAIQGSYPPVEGTFFNSLVCQVRTPYATHIWGIKTY